MKYHLFILGCQQNYADAEKISVILHSLGYQKSSEKEANLVIVVACSVRQRAVDRVWNIIKSPPAGRKQVKKFIICGCVLPDDKRRMASKVDLFFDSSKINNLVHYLKSINLPIKEIYKANRKPFGKIGYASIGIGCNNFCSYCAVPYTRGREQYFKPQTILKEAKELISLGCNEIMLLAQNVNSYNNIDEAGKKTNFINLLKEVNKLEGDFKITFMSPHPKDTSDELITALRNLNKLKKEIHLPLQSGDNEILKKMNRHYTVKHFLNLIKKIRKNIPDMYISTDIIVGFPTETDEQFKSTYKVCKQAKFDKAFISQYSPRKGTAAEKTLPDDVSREVKKQRWEILNNLINKKIK
ncbi:MAG: MiaB/RimO family radical SAM methylthiotransferase [Patescibacteria group bacterium]|jgi:tRNA-2-methylthio-N6-dimethylallyladenosine synthase